jgi:uncharacterized membrane-anchored protein
MENESKREKFLFWLIKNSKKVWLWLPVVIVSSFLAGTGISGLTGLGLTLWGALTFAAGINLALEGVLGADYAKKDMWKKKTK